MGKDPYEEQAHESALKAGKVFYDYSDLLPDSEQTRFFCAQCGAMEGVPWMEIYERWLWVDMWKAIAYRIATRKT